LAGAGTCRFGPALLGWLGWRAVRTGLYARAALDDLDRLQSVMAKPSLSALPQAQADLVSLQTHLVEAQAAGRPFLSIAPAFRWVPRFGPDLAAAPQLIEMTVEIATAGRLASDALTPIARLLSDGGGLDALPQALDSLIAAQPALDGARARLDRAAELRVTLPPLHEPRLVRQIDKLDKLLPLARQAVALAEAAPALLGADQPAPTCCSRKTATSYARRVALLVGPAMSRLTGEADGSHAH